LTHINQRSVEKFLLSISENPKIYIKEHYTKYTDLNINNRAIW